MAKLKLQLKLAMTIFLLYRTRLLLFFCVLFLFMVLHFLSARILYGHTELIQNLEAWWWEIVKSLCMPDRNININWGKNVHYANTEAIVENDL